MKKTIILMLVLCSHPVLLSVVTFLPVFDMFIEKTSRNIKKT